MPSDAKLLTYRMGWVAFLTIVLIGVAVMAVMADDRVAKIEPLSKPDGTLAHPYADLNQCPPNTDIVIWLEEWRSIPNLPSVFSVCFVGTKNKNGDGLEMRGR